MTLIFNVWVIEFDATKFGEKGRFSMEKHKGGVTKKRIYF